MDFTIDQIAQECMKIFQEKIQSLKTLNIIVAGKTGSGKSTLINSVFREELAKTGLGKPVTSHMRRISKKDFPLVVYDTKGFELSQAVQAEVKDEVMRTIKDGLASNDISQTIHCIWYCINAASNRVEPEEIQWLRELSKADELTRVPIIVVLTQCISKKNAQELRRTLEEENLSVEQIVPVLAQDYEIDDEYVAKAFGLDVLIRVMAEVLPDDLLATLANLQTVSLQEKKKQAHAIVAAYTASAIAAGATPIPITDCAVLVPIQIAMIASIAVVFSVDVNKTMLVSFISSALGTSGATLLGKTVVSNLLKLVPGAGSVAGGVISATTAGVLTTALGETFIQIMSMVFKGEMTPKDLESPECKKVIHDVFKDQLKVAL